MKRNRINLKEDYWIIMVMIIILIFLIGGIFTIRYLLKGINIIVKDKSVLLKILPRVIILFVINIIIYLFFLLKKIYLYYKENRSISISLLFEKKILNRKNIITLLILISITLFFFLLNSKLSVHL